MRKPETYNALMKRLTRDVELQDFTTEFLDDLCEDAGHHAKVLTASKTTDWKKEKGIYRHAFQDITFIQLTLSRFLNVCREELADFKVCLELWEWIENVKNQAIQTGKV